MGWAQHGLAMLDGDTSLDERALAIALEHDDVMLELGARSTLAGMLAMTDPPLARSHAEASLQRAAQSEAPWQTVLAGYTNAVSLPAVDLDAATLALRNTRDLADRCGYQYASTLTRVLLVAWAPPAQLALSEAVDALRLSLECGQASSAALLLSPIAGALGAADRTTEATAVNDLLRRLTHEQPLEGRIFAPEAAPSANTLTAGFHFPTVVSLLRHLSVPS